jgi:hypothetical protein
MTRRADRLPTGPRVVGHRVAVACRCGESHSLMLHADSKTAPAAVVSRDGTAAATVANAFPLPAGPLDMGGSCPGATGPCRNCYGAGIELRSPGFGNGAAANLAALRCLYAHGGARAVTVALVAVVRHSETEQRGAGVASPVFRWHSDGDLFAPWYARAVAAASRATPEVEAWLYTRSFGLVRHVVGVDHLRVIVSADSENVERAARVAGRYGLGLAMLADDDEQAVSLWARVAAAGVNPGRVIGCPVTAWASDRLDVPAHVVGPDGRRSSARRGAAAVGACVACGWCLPGASGSVTFVVHGGRARGASAGRLGAAVAVRARRAVAL